MPAFRFTPARGGPRRGRRHAGWTSSSPSYFPTIASLGIPIIAYGLVFVSWLIPVGVVVLLGGLYGWVLEPSTEPEP